MIYKFLESSDNIDNAEIIIQGIPFDGTCSFRKGASRGPDELRYFSDNLETFSPYIKRDIHSKNYADIGNIPLLSDNVEDAHKQILSHTKSYIKNDKKIISIGGDHSITFPLFSAYHEHMKDIFFIVFDAHADIRNEYDGSIYSHACVTNRIMNLIGADNVISMGPRSYTKEEFELLNRLAFYNEKPVNIDKKLISNKAIYISIDVDILDPSIMPGTGTPEAGGWQFNELIECLYSLKGLNIVGCDIVELAPKYDKSGISAAAAAKILREMILII